MVLAFQDRGTRREAMRKVGGLGEVAGRPAEGLWGALGLLALAPLLLLAIYWVIWTSSAGYRRRMSRNVGVGAGTTPPAPSSAGGAAVAADAARGLGEGVSPSPFG